MNLKNFFKFLFTTTFILLVYIHLQMKIFGMAYHAQTNQKKIQELNDANGRLTYQILALKSANNLGKQILENKSELQFIESDKIFKLSTPAPISQKVILQKPVKLVPKTADNLSKLITWFTPQTAEAEEFSDGK